MPQESQFLSLAHFQIMYFVCLFVLILSFMSCLCILNIKILLVISFANIFSHLHRLVFCFVGGVLCCPKAFKCNQVPVVCFALFLLFAYCCCSVSKSCLTM